MPFCLRARAKVSFNFSRPIMYASRSKGLARDNSWRPRCPGPAKVAFEREGEAGSGGGGGVLLRREVTWEALDHLLGGFGEVQRLCHPRFEEVEVV